MYLLPTRPHSWSLRTFALPTWQLTRKCMSEMCRVSTYLVLQGASTSGRRRSGTGCRAIRFRQPLASRLRCAEPWPSFTGQTCPLTAPRATSRLAVLSSCCVRAAPLVVRTMTRARRGRSGRSQKTPDPTGATEDGDTPTQALQEGEEGAQAQTQDDKCPACKDAQGDTPLTVAEKEKWVRCDACKSWFHWRCVGEGGDLDAVDKWCVLLSKSRSAWRITATILRCVIGSAGRAWTRTLLASSQRNLRRASLRGRRRNGIMPG